MSTDLEHESSGEIRRDIETTRSKLDETIDQIGERLNPRHILDDVVDVFRSPGNTDPNAAVRGTTGTLRVTDAVAEISQSVSHTIRDNPLASVLLGAGLAALAFKSTRSSTSSTSHGRSAGQGFLPVEAIDQDDVVCRGGPGDPNGLGQTESTAFSNQYVSNEDMIMNTSTQSNDRGNNPPGESQLVYPQSYDTAAYRQESPESEGFIDSAKHAISDAASAVTSKFSGGSPRRSSGPSSVSVAATKVRRAAHENPLGVGAAVLGLGLLAGALIPETDAENHLMGESADEIRERARRQAQAAAGQAKARGQAAYATTVGTASHIASEEGLTPGTLLDQAKQVATNVAKSAYEGGKQSAMDALSESNLTPEQIKAKAERLARETKDAAAVELEAAKTDAKVAVQDAAKADPDAEEAVAANMS